MTNVESSDSTVVGTESGTDEEISDEEELEDEEDEEIIKPRFTRERCPSPEFDGHPPSESSSSGGPLMGDLEGERETERISKLEMYRLNLHSKLKQMKKAGQITHYPVLVQRLVDAAGRELKDEKGRQLFAKGEMIWDEKRD